MPKYQRENALRPGGVREIRGIAFQNDGQSTIGRVFIRPMEALDRWIAGILIRPGAPELAMHAGIHVVLDDGREFVAEQLVGSLYLTFNNGLNWTPFEQFMARNRGGWSTTLAPECFRGIDRTCVDESLGRLNAIQGHPFIGEDCTAFVERVFGGRRLFADSPFLQWLGFGMRLGDPALPLLRRDAPIDVRARRLLQFERIADLPEPSASADSPNGWLWAHRALPLLALLAAARLYSSASRKSTPISRTARRFLR